MTTDQEVKKISSGRISLTPQEQAICKKVATREAPHSQRASALLALNEGATQAKAAEQAGLTSGKVKYWVGRFRKLRLGILPDTLLDELNADAEAASFIKIEEEPEAVTEEVESAESEVKEKNINKVKKGKKKTKKANKKKKGKKAKKSKKNLKAKKKKKGKKEKNKKAKKSKK